ncbi:hypothetical protein ACFOYU_26875 [Microvirga sp. GCM10011540]|uniref:hypothetical protein n=1 Tax=Microvirga sp. GCM10011540 TaxID=3317338 RepID=UPI003623CE46
MPVLDAKALKTDPKGAAFLLGVLRRTPVSPPKDESKQGAAQIRSDRRREEFLQEGTTRP